MFVGAFQNVLKAGHFNRSLTHKTDANIEEMIRHVKCYINGEESNAEKRS
jgi:hypothetical protein